MRRNCNFPQNSINVSFFIKMGAKYELTYNVVLIYWELISSSQIKGEMCLNGKFSY
jgi:hypothetical protein